MILFVGIPGCGKSTFYMNNFFNSHLRVSLDLLKTRKSEEKILEFCFKTSMPLVIDNTNVSEDDRKKYMGLAKANRYKIKGYFFMAEFKDCLARNEQRAEKERVPLKGMYAKYYKLQAPRMSEGFDELLYVEIIDNEFVVRPIEES